MPTQFAIPRIVDGKYSPDGKQFVYEEIAPWEDEFRNYRGGQNTPLRIIDLKSFAVEKCLGKTAVIFALSGLAIKFIFSQTEIWQ